MLKSERKQFILEKVLKEKFVSLETLVQELGTSESTVRRDLDELEAESKLRRVHGGCGKPALSPRGRKQQRKIYQKHSS